MFAILLESSKKEEEEEEEDEEDEKREREREISFIGSFPRSRRSGQKV